MLKTPTMNVLLLLSHPHRAIIPLTVIFQEGSERRLTATIGCLLVGRTEEIRGAAGLITDFLSAVGNKTLIVPHDAPGSSRQMDVGLLCHSDPQKPTA